MMRRAHHFKHAAMRIAVAMCVLAIPSQVAIAGLCAEECPFVMRFEGTDFMFVWNPTIDPNVGNCDPIATTLASGLYRTKEPPELVWRFNGVCYSKPVYLSTDGKTLSFTRPFASYDPIYLKHLIMFYRDGFPAKKYYYDEGELSSMFVLKHFAANREIRVVDEGFNGPFYHVTTNVGERFVFDCDTGQLVRFDDPFTFVVWLVLSVATLLAVAAVVWWYKRRARRSAYPLGEPSA